MGIDSLQSLVQFALVGATLHMGQVTAHVGAGTDRSISRNGWRHEAMWGGAFANSARDGSRGWMGAERSGEEGRVAERRGE